MARRHDPTSLTWSAVEPWSHPFDPSGTATALLKALPPPLPPKSRGTPFLEGAEWTAQVSSWFVARHGEWACGWCWAGGEGDIGGGPVHAWCCPPHSMGSPEVSVQRAVEGLSDWRRWLEQLELLFASHPLDPGHDVAFQVELAVVEILGAVMSRTGCEDAWYGHAEQVLGWYLEARGQRPERAGKWLHKALSGRFESWSSPGTEVVEAIGKELGDALSREFARRA